jgi:Na+/proline symporter
MEEKESISEVKSTLITVLGYIGLGISIASGLFWFDGRWSLTIGIAGIVAGILVNLGAFLLKIKYDDEASEAVEKMMHKSMGLTED